MITYLLCMASRVLASLVSCLLVVLSTTAHAEAPLPRRAPTADAVLLPNGLALPYPPLRVFRAFGKCKGKGKRPERWQGAWRSHEHEGIDLGGLGPDGGLGTAVRSMNRARVVEIAHGDDLPAKFGVIDRRAGLCTRDGTDYPRSFALAGYGEVHFFTRARGWYRTGNMVVTEGLDGRLAGHRVRYMHLGAARPDLVVGAIVEAGEELGVLGGTAVQDDDPHLHLDIRDPDGESVDVAPLIGLVTSAWCGVPRRRALEDAHAFKAAATTQWRPDTWAPPVGVAGRDGRQLAPIDLLRTPAPLVEVGFVAARSRFWHDTIVPVPCASATIEEDFSSGAYAGHAWRLKMQKAQAFDVAFTTLSAPTPPRFAIVDQTLGRVSHPRKAQPDIASHPRKAQPDIASHPRSAPTDGLVTSLLGPGRVRISAATATDVLIVVLAQAQPYRITTTDRCQR